MIRIMDPKQLSPHELGAWGENKAQEYLLKEGFEILDTNVRTDYGEIDLIACAERRVHFIEVKTRRSAAFGYPEESIGPVKTQHLLDNAEAYMQSNPDLGPEWQIVGGIYSFFEPVKE
jgi:putative endonuclease